MMPAAGIPGGGTVSRPFIFAVVLVLLFLSARTDIENPERKLEAAAERGSEKRSAALKEHDAVSEKIMLDVSLDNERLEEVNRRLRLEVLALRRAVRRAGGELPMGNETLIGVSAAALGLDEMEHDAEGGAAQGVTAADFPPAADGAVGEAAEGEPGRHHMRLASRRALDGWARVDGGTDMRRRALDKARDAEQRPGDAAHAAV